jgi:hypothetical protein
MHGSLAVLHVVVVLTIAPELYKRKMPTVASAAPLFAILGSAIPINALLTVRSVAGVCGTNAASLVALAPRVAQDLPLLLLHSAVFCASHLPTASSVAPNLAQYIAK